MTTGTSAGAAGRAATRRAASTKRRTRAATRHAPSTVLVTGGAGFIGRHVVARLLAGGVPVRVLDDLSAGDVHALPPDARLVEGDVTDARVVRRAMAGVRAVVHLAALTSVPESLADPVRYHHVNGSGTAVVLEAARKAGVAQGVVASSAAVYGAPRKLPQSEHDPPAPESPYGLTKWLNEHQCRLARMDGPQWTALRLFNVFGPGQDPASPYASVVPRFLAQAQAGRPLPVHGDGSQTRDFVHVDDVAKVVARLVAPDAPEAPVVLNVGSGKERSVAEVAATVIKVTGSKAGIHHEPARAGDVARSVADVSLLRDVMPDLRPTPFGDALGSTWQAWMARRRG